MHNLNFLHIRLVSSKKYIQRLPCHEDGTKKKSNYPTAGLPSTADGKPVPRPVTFRTSADALNPQLLGDIRQGRSYVLGLFRFIVTRRDELRW